MAKVLFCLTGTLQWLGNLMDHLPVKASGAEQINIDISDSKITMTHSKSRCKATIDVMPANTYIEFDDPSHERKIRVVRQTDKLSQIAEELHFFFQGVK